ncbi:uncharacterized protein LOC129908382 isoform X2 [Episyrphus balteatus]|nr:uncharacterized protein LOC129908382 isoform X2 [Episyrphus balteatus]
MDKNRQAIYESTIAQAKYTNKNLLSTFILVTVAKGETFLNARDATTFSVHLVVRTRKCLKNNNSRNSCMIFIDEHGRVYKNWNSYIADNLLPEGVALAPSNGCYSYENGKLCVESWPTPSSKPRSKLVDITDVAANVGAFTAAGITIAALALPVAAPLMALSGFVGISTGIYTTVRSGWQLQDRSNHGQTIALTDSQSRGCWLGLTTGALAVSSSVTNKLIQNLATAGRDVTLLEEVVVNGMNIAAMMLSGTGVVNGVVYIIIKIADDEETTPTDWLQLAGSLAIFTHSIYNYRLASNIMSQNRASRGSLFKNLVRQISDKIFTSTNSTQGNVDVIRLTNMIPDSYMKVSNALALAEKVYVTYNHIVLSKDNLEDCIQCIFQAVGESITQYLADKAFVFIGRFGSQVEGYIKTTLFYETALWDLYKKCEFILRDLTIRGLDASINNIFSLLLQHYKQMTWRDPCDKVFCCKECGGSYTVTS